MQIYLFATLMARSSDVWPECLNSGITGAIKSRCKQRSARSLSLSLTIRLMPSSEEPCVMTGICSLARAVAARAGLMGSAVKPEPMQAQAASPGRHSTSQAPCPYYSGAGQRQNRQLVHQRGRRGDGQMMNRSRLVQPLHLPLEQRPDLHSLALQTGLCFAL